MHRGKFNIGRAPTGIKAVNRSLNGIKQLFNQLKKALGQLQLTASQLMIVFYDLKIVAGDFKLTHGQVKTASGGLKLTDGRLRKTSGNNIQINRPLEINIRSDEAINNDASRSKTVGTNCFVTLAMASIKDLGSTIRYPH